MVFSPMYPPDVMEERGVENSQFQNVTWLTVSGAANRDDVSVQLPYGVYEFSKQEEAQFFNEIWQSSFVHNDFDNMLTNVNKGLTLIETLGSEKVRFHFDLKKISDHKFDVKLRLNAGEQNVLSLKHRFDYRNPDNYIHVQIRQFMRDRSSVNSEQSGHVVRGIGLSHTSLGPGSTPGSASLLVPSHAFGPDPTSGLAFGPAPGPINDPTPGYVPSSTSLC